MFSLQGFWDFCIKCFDCNAGGHEIQIPLMMVFFFFCFNKSRYEKDVYGLIFFAIFLRISTKNEIFLYSFFSSLTLIPKLKETTVGVLNCDDDHEADDNNNVDDDGVQFLLLL